MLIWVTISNELLFPLVIMISNLHQREIQFFILSISRFLNLQGWYICHGMIPLASDGTQCGSMTDFPHYAKVRYFQKAAKRDKKDRRLQRASKANIQDTHKSEVQSNLRFTQETVTFSFDKACANAARTRLCMVFGEIRGWWFRGSVHRRWSRQGISQWYKRFVRYLRNWLI